MDFKKKKKFGQNFLNNQQIIRRIVSESGIDNSFGVLEIGPGLGALTTELAEKAARVVSVEIDHDLIPILNSKFEANSNVSIIENDILKVDIDSLIKDYFSGLNVAVCANLPYYITTPIIMKLLEGNYGFKSITVMVQKEVAERFISKPGSSEYGAITVSINYYADVKKLFNVGSGNFTPPPKVDSAIVQFIPHTNKYSTLQNEDLFFNIIKAAFIQRRKTLCNALSSVIKTQNKEFFQSIINECGFDSLVRGEYLSVEDFIMLTNKINESKA